MSSIYRQFSLLCESILVESSLALSDQQIRSAIGGLELVKYLHEKHFIAHDTAFKPINFKEIRWSEIVKKSNYSILGSSQLFIMFGKNGSAALLLNKSTYTARVYYRDQTDQTLQYKKLEATSSRKILTEIKSLIGDISPQGYYVSGSKQAVNKVRLSREERKDKIDSKYLLKKFNPLFVKLITQALASSTEHAREAIKNHSYETAAVYSNNARKLRRILDDIEYEKNTQSAYSGLTYPIRNAIFLTALHYYPDDFTDETIDQIQSNLSHFIDSDTAQKVGITSGIKKTINDIANNDREKLSMLLYFFKRGLMIMR
jgi:hypothetical protein